MSVCSNLTVISDVCSLNYTPSREQCNPVAYVLHLIPNFTTEAYLNSQTTQFLLGKDYYTDYPKSVHYLISDQAAVYKLVENHDRAWGVTELFNPSWSLLNVCDFDDHEDLFIHIGFIGGSVSAAQIDAAAQLICCLVVDGVTALGVGNDTVIVARDLDTRLDALWSVPNNLIAKAQVCVNNNGVDPLDIDNLPTYGPRIDELERWRAEEVDPALDSLQICCDTNTAAIAQLEIDVGDLQQEIEDINVDSLVQRIEALEQGNVDILQQLQIITDCLECNNICDPVLIEDVVYRLDSSNPVKLVPGSIQVLNLPIRISDVNPPIVNTGPLWYAFLGEDEQTSCTRFRAELTVQLSAATWCAGRVLEIYAIVNSQNILIDTYTATDGSQTAIISGSTEFSVPPDTTVQFGVKTDEDTEPLEVILATGVISCLDGVITPNCTNCP